MNNILSEKYIKCFEWKVIASKNGTVISSNYFFIQQQKCSLQFLCDNYDAVLLFNIECFRSPMNIFLNVSSTAFNSQVKMCSITSKKVIIWRCNEGNLHGIPLTFDVISKTDIFQKTKTTSGSNASQDMVPSYLNENTHFKVLSRDFSKLLKDDDNFDVTITCEGKIYYAHKIILQMRSSVLSAMLKSDMIEGRTGLITLKDITPPILEGFLQYIYSGSIPVLTMDTAKEFYKVSDQYAVEELKKACSEFMTKNLSETNACEILVLADFHNDEDFQKMIMAYIVEKKIPQSGKNWSDFCKCHCTLAINVLNLYIKKHCSQ